MAQQQVDAVDAIQSGQTSLGIELGSTRIKACLIGPDHAVIATGSHGWENQFVDRMWTYSVEAIWEGLQAAFADLVANVEAAHGVRLTSVGALGVSAMMHGYLAFDAADELLVPFRTWRNTTTEAAAAELTEELGFNFPLRWSASHLYQAVIDQEPHVGEVAFFTTLAGYVHWRLTGRKVLGVGDASGMFPIDPATRDYDAAMLERFDALVAGRQPGMTASSLLPEVLVAGQDAGALTAAGAALLDPTGGLQPGAVVCPPEGDAGTGMIATNAVAPRTGNISAGTSIFAMVVLERPLTSVHEELDIVTTPAGDLVAMVHCNNGASELGTWAGVFTEFAAAMGVDGGPDAVFETLFRAALEGEADGGGLLAYNYLSGEPITGLAEGRPLVVRTPGSRLTLANFMRTQLYAAFGTLSLGMRVLHDEGVELDSMFAHGGMFRTAGVAQRLLAAAIDAPVTVGDTASEGGAWGIAVLAEHLRAGAGADLSSYLAGQVFADAALDVAAPVAADVEGYGAWLAQYEAGLAIERAATQAIH
ncbi:FGGY-family carbohydrate kinase [Demequina sp. SYSU T00039]|uniref:FGGY-family carbohydrate kinase n=1 Tax=Demequina lignilytica TaxID=3051663 RepID=A0AAW7M9F5_9MICO|nr:MULTISPECIES: FGGY-family carbohydrate kinase [unclassified Demequina]MDN4478244.1 FGGY-family carbohydrate kinase [Demequina sp. SYSU T00039-1]MDN4488306.1 FGGY-family carbohydrate kinase [Demequina sp. SYSU T00039]MDN4490147.1 FGGY-family carbohydrate kinase [Demequina sp. SYSU T00068]